MQGHAVGEGRVLGLVHDKDNSKYWSENDLEGWKTLEKASELQRVRVAAGKYSIRLAKRHGLRTIRDCK